MMAATVAVLRAVTDLAGEHHTLGELLPFALPPRHRPRYPLN
jgi:hypothetical protein